MKNSKSYKFTVNQQPYNLELPSDIPLLWILRDYLNLSGTKYGCGIGACGNCMVLMSNQPVNACQITAEQIDGQQITTIEGLSEEGLHPVQQAWLDENVVQCGYCQSGQIITAVALLSQAELPDTAEIDRLMSKVLCRCGTYPRIKIAIQKLLEAKHNATDK